MEERITELEVKLSYAEDLLDQLNLTVFRQQQHIDGLEQALRDLRHLVLTAIPQEQGSLRDELPPHY